MASEAVKLARIQRDRELLAGFLELAKHPIYSVLIAFALTEYLQAHKLMGENVGTMLEAGVIAAPVLTAVANSGALAAMVKVPGEVLSGLTSLVPLAVAK